jgi:alkylhydroperoxidase/carboxymuconolactone decarboxylase family protein YurZ
MKYSPKYYRDFKKRYPEVAKSFDQLAQDCAKAGPLAKQTQYLVKLGVAIGIGSEGDVQNLAMQALAAGVSPDEIRQAVLLSLTVTGFPAMIVAMQWVEEILAAEAK